MAIDLTDIKGIGEATAKRLREAGVRTVEELRSVNVGEIAEKTGVRAETLRRWRDEAARLLEEGVEAVASTAERASREAAQRAVLLRDRATTARVRAEGVLYENLPIITAKVSESQAEVAKTIRENAVLLKEKADTAWVQIEGVWHKNVPIFKEVFAEGERAARGAVEEVRVFVKEIRERPAEALKPSNLLRRLWGKRPQGR